MRVIWIQFQFIIIQFDIKIATATNHATYNKCRDLRDISRTGRKTQKNNIRLKYTLNELMGMGNTQTELNISSITVVLLTSETDVHNQCRQASTLQKMSNQFYHNNERNGSTEYLKFWKIDFRLSLCICVYIYFSQWLYECRYDYQFVW